MNYGYNEGTANWDKTKVTELAQRLIKELPINLGWVAGGVSPYLEINNLYEGVRIRKITHLEAEDRRNFIKRADKIYNEVMGNL